METLRLLLIHPDISGNRDVFAALESASHSMLPATGLSEAAEALYIQRFDAVLLHPSLSLDGLEGFTETLRKLERAQKLQVKTPVILVSDDIPGDADWYPAPTHINGLDAIINNKFGADTLQAAVGQLTSTVADSSSELSIFEEETFLSSVGHDSGLVIEVVDMFFADCARQFPDLQRALTDRNEVELARIAHSFKGSLSSLQAPRARSYVQELETAAKSNGHQKCQQLLDELGRELAALEPVLVRLRTRLSSEAAPLLHCGCSPLPN